MEKQYHALIEDRIYFGGANDVQQMADEEHIDVVVDLREESTGCAASQPHLTWMQIPLGDHALVPESDLFKESRFPLRWGERPDGNRCGGRSSGAWTVPYS